MFLWKRDGVGEVDVVEDVDGVVGVFDDDEGDLWVDEEVVVVVFVDDLFGLVEGFVV